MNEVFLLCREANIVLGPVAFGAVCYRVAIGVVERKITYWPLLLVMTYYSLIVLLTSPTGLAIKAPATYIQTMATVGHLAAILVCIFYPGPHRRGVGQQ